MIPRLEAVVVDCDDPLLLVRFWSHLLGGEAVDRDPDWAYVDPAGCPRLAFQRVPEGKAGKNRIHLDIEVDDIDAVADRLVAEHGAARVGVIVHDKLGDFQIMHDPELNEFCLVSD